MKQLSKFALFTFSLMFSPFGAQGSFQFNLDFSTSGGAHKTALSFDLVLTTNADTGTALVTAVQGTISDGGTVTGAMLGALGYADDELDFGQPFLFDYNGLGFVDDRNYQYNLYSTASGYTLAATDPYFSFGNSNHFTIPAVVEDFSAVPEIDPVWIVIGSVILGLVGRRRIKYISRLVDHSSS